MAVEEPAEPLECLPALLGSLSPLFLTNIIHSVVEGLDDMEPVQDQRGVLAVVLNSPPRRRRSCRSRPTGSGFSGEGLGEEPVDGLAAFAGTDPDYTRPVQIVDDSSVFVTLGVGDLIDSNRLEASDLVSLPAPFDGSVQQVGKRW